jgi:anti-sigma B factor antagonist
MRAIEQTALLRLEDAESLFEESAVHAVSQQLHRLVQDEGYTRLVVNLAGVRFLSSNVLGVLVAVQKEIDPARGRVILCGLEPLLREMIRITHLDRVFETCNDEAEALSLLSR